MLFKNCSKCGILSVYKNNILLNGVCGVIILLAREHKECITIKVLGREGLENRSQITEVPGVA